LAEHAAARARERIARGFPWAYALISGCVFQTAIAKHPASRRGCPENVGDKPASGRYFDLLSDS